jgi:hypothetical protein
VFEGLVSKANDAQLIRQKMKQIAPIVDGKELQNAAQ